MADESKTTYVVLRRDDSGYWRELEPTIQARSAWEAIQNALNGQSGEAATGIFSAVPARSFKPVSVIAETKTVLTQTSLKIDFG